LLPQTVAESSELLPQVVVDARQLAELHDARVVGLHAPKGRAVGPQGVREDEGVAPVILGPGDRVPVAKAIELLGIDREDMHAALKQGIDDGSAGHFDGHRDAAGLRRSQRGELVRQSGEPHSAVRKVTRRDLPPVAIEHADGVRLTPPIHPHEELVFRLRH